MTKFRPNPPRRNPIGSQLRAALIQQLGVHLPSLAGRLAVPEFVVCNSHARPALAVLDETGSHAFVITIRHDRETLERLARQMHFTGRVFEFLWVVTAERHLAAALEIVPPHAGVLVTTGSADSIRFAIRREASRNPEPVGDALLPHLWRSELRQLIEEHGQLGWDPALEDKNKEFLMQLLVSRSQPQELRAVAVRLLAARTNWRTAGHSLSPSIIPIP